jgi:hypothetical protein
MLGELGATHHPACNCTISKVQILCSGGWEGELTVVTEKLRTQIKTVQRNLVLAGEAGLPYEVYLHRARLEDLMETAARRGIDVATWVDGSRLPFALAEE